MYKHTGATGCIAAIDAKIVQGSGKVQLPSGEFVPRAVKVFVVVAADGQILWAEAYYHTGRDEVMFKDTRLYKWLLTKKLPVFKRWVDGHLIVVPGFFTTDHQMDLFSQFAKVSQNLVSGSVNCAEEKMSAEERYVNRLIKTSNGCCELTFGTITQQYASFDTLPPCGKPCTRNLLLVLIPVKLRELIMREEHERSVKSAVRTKMVANYVRKADKSTYQIILKAHKPLATGLDGRPYGPKQLTPLAKAIPPQGFLLAAAGRVQCGMGSQNDLNAVIQHISSVYGLDMLQTAVQSAIHYERYDENE